MAMADEKKVKNTAEEKEEAKPADTATDTPADNTADAAADITADKAAEAVGTEAQPSEGESSEEMSDKEVSSEDEADGKKKKKDGKDKKEDKKLAAELAETKKKLAETEKALAETEDKYLRMLAEYQNFRTRSQKEKSEAYADAYCDAVTQLLPLIDNLDRALAFADSDKLAEGVALIVKSIPDILGKLGVEEIEVTGKPFDPNVADAVMRTEEGDAEEGTVVAVLQKGYRRGDKIVRHAMVSVKA